MMVASGRNSARSKARSRSPALRYTRSGTLVLVAGMSAVAKLGASDGARCWSSLYIAAIDPCWAKVTPAIAAREIPTMNADTPISLVVDRMVESPAGQPVQRFYRRFHGIHACICAGLPPSLAVGYPP